MYGNTNARIIENKHTTYAICVSMIASSISIIHLQAVYTEMITNKKEFYTDTTNGVYAIWVPIYVQRKGTTILMNTSVPTSGIPGWKNWLIVPQVNLSNTTTITGGITFEYWYLTLSSTYVHHSSETGDLPYYSSSGYVVDYANVLNVGTVLAYPDASVNSMEMSRSYKISTTYASLNEDWLGEGYTV